MDLGSEARSDLEGARRKSTRTLFVTVAFGTTALYAAFTASPLVANELTGSASWSGVPGAAAVLGAGLGAGAISRLMAARGRRPGLVLGYTIAVVGAILAAIAFDASAFVVLLFGMLLIGIGHGASQLSRFIAADLQPTARRGSALAWIVWASTVGAAAGPALLQPMRSAATSASLPPLAGGFMIAVVAYAVAALLCAALLRPDPSTLAYDDSAEQVAAGGLEIGAVWKVPAVRMALVVLLVSQGAMVLIMTMTPLHIRASGHSLGAIGLVMSSHFVGMFALAPVAGKLVDRIGARAVALAGLAILLVATVIAGLAPGSSHIVIALSLFMLGLGWSLAFVAGSGMLAGGLPYAQRVRMQGNVDTLMWTVGAAASLSSGVLLDILSFSALCVVGGAMVAVAAAVILPRRLRMQTI